MTISSAWTHASLILFAASGAVAQEGEAVPCDRNAIEWVLPGDFPEALARAKRDQRILVIKGISFGVDSAGATCATKGVW